MNEKELIEFVEWLPKNVEKFSKAKPEEIISYLNDLGKTPEGQNEFKSLVNAFKQSKSGITVNKQGGKIDYLVNKFYIGGKTDKDTVEIHNKMFLTPLFMSTMAAKGVDVPRFGPNQDPREYKYIKSNFSNKRWGVIQNKRTKDATYFELDENNNPINSSFGGKTYYPGDDMFDEHVRRYKHYTRDIVIPSDKNGGKIDYSELVKLNK